MKMEPEKGGQDRENRERWYSFVGIGKGEGGPCGRVTVCLCVRYRGGGKRKEQFMVYERMSEIGG